MLQSSNMIHMRSKYPLSRLFQTSTLLISSYSTTALELFDEIPHLPTPRSLAIALKASANLSDLPCGRTIHGLVTKIPSASSDPFVATALIELYAKCSQMPDAIAAFEQFTDPDVVMWSSVVSGYQRNGDYKAAVDFFSQMAVVNAVRPDPITVISLVSALGRMGNIRGGKCCHAFLVRFGFERNLKLANAILNLYSKLGAVESAVRLFEAMVERDVVTWSCMIACFGRNGKPVEALDVYKRMVEAGSEPNRVTLISVIQACSLALDLEQGRKVHDLTVRKGFETDAAVATSLIDMYMKCRCHDEAMDIFDRTGKRDAVAWAAVIGGCAQNGFPGKSVKFFRTMLLDGTYPDAVTMVKVLAACSQLGVLRQAICFHGYLLRSGFSNKLFVASGLIDLYSKCGSLNDAVKVFDGTTGKDVVLWSSMIAGYGIHGLGGKAIATFQWMVESSVKPNNVTFLSVLSACSHAGLLTEGRRIFDSMSENYGVIPDWEHCTIMVDLLARGGDLKGAMRVIRETRHAGRPDVWCALLAGCRIHQNVEMGELVGRILLEMQPSHAGYYNLVSNMYACDDRWDQAADVRRVIKDRGLKRTPAYSSVEVGREVHSFVAGERRRDELDDRVDKLLRRLEVHMREEGRVPDGCTIASFVADSESRQ